MDIHDTIRRLLQMTVENGASIQEAETAAAAVRRLLDKHGLTLEQVKAKFDQPQHGVEAERYDTHWQRIPLWVKGLGMSLADGFDCRVLGVNGGTIMFLGFPPEPAVAMYLFRVLSQELPLAAERQGRFLKYRGDELRDWKDSFLIGAGHRIGQRLLQERTRSTSATALTVCKLDTIKDAMGSFPDVDPREKAVKLRASDANGFVAGDEHGRRVCLNSRPLPAPPQQTVLAGFLPGNH